MNKALETSAIKSGESLRSLMQNAMERDAYAPQETAAHFGLACHVHQGMPIVWYILQHTNSFESAVKDNILCGGDSCGRAMAVGAIAGLAYGVPESLQSKTHGSPY